MTSLDADEAAAHRQFASLREIRDEFLPGGELRQNRRKGEEQQQRVQREKDARVGLFHPLSPASG